MASGGGAGTRVVFVSVRGRDAALPRTRRKRALGIAEDATWESFLVLVCTRLQLRGVAAIYHASTGAPMTSMEELQDIEDLEEIAEDAAPPPGARGGAQAGFSSPGAAAPPFGRAESARKPAAASSASETDAEEGDKYARRGSTAARALTSMLPVWMAPARGAEPAPPATPGARRFSVGGVPDEALGEPSATTRQRMRQRRGGAAGAGGGRSLLRQLRDPRMMLMLIAFFSFGGTMVLLYSRLSPLERHLR